MVLRETPKSRATRATDSPSSICPSAASLNSRLKDFPLIRSSYEGPVTLSLSHFRGAQHFCYPSVENVHSHCLARPAGLEPATPSLEVRKPSRGGGHAQALKMRPFHGSFYT